MPYETYDKLVAEADALPASKPPSRQFYNPISQQRKSEEEYDKDQRRLYILDRLKEVQNDAPIVLDPGPLRKQLASPVEHYAQPGFPVFNEEKGRAVHVPGQYLGEDSPIWKGLTWMGSPVSAVANASRELANQADRGVSYMLGQEPVEHYPNALNNAIKDVGDFAAGFGGFTHIDAVEVGRPVPQALDDEMDHDALALHGAAGGEQARAHCGRSLVEYVEQSYGCWVCRLQ